MKIGILDFYQSNIGGFIAFSIKVGIFDVFCDVNLKINICIVENPIQVLKSSWNSYGLDVFIQAKNGLCASNRWFCDEKCQKHHFLDIYDVKTKNYIILEFLK